jgi:putative DNA primase/helicase
VDAIDALLEKMVPGPVSPARRQRSVPKAMAPAPASSRKLLRKKSMEFDQDGAPMYSDIALAGAFASEAAPHFKCSPGLGWMVNDGTRYVRDDKLQRMTLAKACCVRHAGTVDDEKEARAIASARTVNAVVMLAQADPALVVATDCWDADPMAFNTPGGIVDLKTGILRERRESDFVTQAARVTPSTEFECPTWHRFLESIFLGDRELIEFMRRSMGYMLTGDRREQILFFFYGVGANGKSVLNEFLLWLCSGYSIKLPASALMQARGERHPTELAQLRGKRLAVSSELDENCYFNESLIKELTGDTTLAARFMRQDFFEFVMQQKHVVVGNFKPRLRGGDPAMARRMVLVPFNACFKGDDRDPHMLEKLKAEAPAILAWIVRGAVDWSQGGLAIPARVRDASAEYMADHDDMAQWIDECCERAGEGKASDLYASFTRWKKARGEHAPSQTIWGSRVASLEGVSKRRSNGWRYTNLRLTEQELRSLDVNTF